MRNKKRIDDARNEKAEKNKEIEEVKSLYFTASG